MKVVTINEQEFKNILQRLNSPKPILDIYKELYEVYSLVSSGIEEVLNKADFRDFNFVNPLIAILPRILIGIVAGGSFSWLKKRLAKQSSAMVLAAILGSLTNTLLVLGQIYLFYRGKSQAMYALNVNELLPYLLGVIATNGLPEAILAGLVSPLIAGPLRKRLKNN